MDGPGLDELAPLWDRQALQWSKLTPPLRPSPADLATAQAVLDRWPDLGSPRRTALVLGGTPEVAALAWPTDATVLTVDLSSGVLRDVWRPAVPPGSRAIAVRGDWRRLPAPDSTVDVVLGDGSLNSLPGLVAADVVADVGRVLRPGGLLSVRVYVAPDGGEGPDAVWEALVDGRFPSFALFKFHLLMSLRSPDGDVRVTDAWTYFTSRCSSPEELAVRLGWPVDVIRTIEAYREQPSVYWFPTSSQFRQALAPVFEEVRCEVPTYDGGERCPTYLLRRAG